MTQSGDFAIADFNHATLDLYGSDGKKKKSLAGAGRGYGELIRPLALATSGGEIFVYDIGKTSLLRFDRSGNCIADNVERTSSVSCSFAVWGLAQYRVGGLVLPDKRLCPVYSIDLAGTPGSARPLVCYDSREEWELFSLQAGCGYVDAIGERIHVAIPSELRIRVLDERGKEIRNFPVGGASAIRPSRDGMTIEKAALASELWAWHSKFTFIDGLASLPERVVVLIQDPKPRLGWRLEVYDRNGNLRQTLPVAQGAKEDNNSVRLTSDHQSSVYLLVRQPSAAGATTYRVEKYELLGKK